MLNDKCCKEKYVRKTEMEAKASVCTVSIYMERTMDSHCFVYTRNYFLLNSRCVVL